MQPLRHFHTNIKISLTEDGVKTGTVGILVKVCLRQYTMKTKVNSNCLYNECYRKLIFITTDVYKFIKIFRKILKAYFTAKKSSH